MFDKILIANRGEIACRVIRSARQMGVATVAVYSEPDADALHVRMADEAVAIGPAASAESYLRIDKIVAACKQTGAQAVHPGYGFLAENEAFAEALDKEGIAFIGPNLEAIAAMGDKIASKRLAMEAKVNTVPGHVGVIADATEAVKIARDIGYPVMIKASAGGGGKGMRTAYSDQEVEDGFRAAASEAKSSFGDDRIFIEKFIEEPHHIEIQVLADAHGNTVYLGERECSIQRRHQKVIEEAPSPFLDDATRKAMGEQAVALAEAVNYRSAGTVEFIVDKDKNFFFLEMNTRLQVEHPVTEMVTGLDLVELMIRVAAGEKLSFGQDDIRHDGWAIEARVYAEDPYRNFLPSIGRLVRYAAPEEDEGIRVDSGVYEGAGISMFYDPMISKLIAHGSDRDEAAERLLRALDGYTVTGVNHNIAFLAALMRHPRFLSGVLTTNFIAEEYPEGFEGAPIDAEDRAIFVAAAAAMLLEKRTRDAATGGTPMPRPEPDAHAWTVALGADHIDVTVEGEAGDCIVTFDVEGEERGFPVISAWRPGQALFEAEIAGAQVRIQVRPEKSGWRLIRSGMTVSALVVSRRTAELMRLMPEKVPPDTSKFVLSPMPGALVSVAVEAGQEVKAGEEVAVVEAMKMENLLRAERDGIVKSVHAAPGDALALDQPILEFE